MYQIELSPQSKEHIEGLYAFYEKQESGRGSSWMLTLIDEMDRLERRPFIGAYLTTREEGIRRLISQDTYKTVIVYRVDGQLIRVSGIYDSRSDWK